MSKRLPKKPSRWTWLKGLTRDLSMFSVGLTLVIYEAVIRKEAPRESLLVLYAAMMGLPAIIRADQLRRRQNGNGEGE